MYKIRLGKWAELFLGKIRNGNKFRGVKYYKKKKK